MEKDTPQNPDEFSRFLEAATAEDQLKLEIEIKANELEVRFREALSELGYESLPTEMNTRGAWTEYLIENDEDSAEMKRAKAEELDIRAVLTVWGMMEIALDPNLADAQRLASQRTMKVGMYVLLLENGRYEIEHPMLEVTNKLLPGEAVSPEDEDAVRAMLALREPEDGDGRTDIEMVISEAYSATDISVYEDAATAEKMAETVLKIVSVIHMRSLFREANDQSWHAQREAMIREKSLKYGLPSLYADQLVAYFVLRDEQSL